MAPKLRSQTRTSTSWSCFPTEIRQMILGEVALAVCHDAIPPPIVGVHDPVDDTAAPLNFIARINYELGQQECIQVLERLATDLSLQEYFLDEKIYEPDNILAEKEEDSEDDSEDSSEDDSEEDSEDDSEDDSDVNGQDDEESEDEEMIDASTIAIASDEAGDSETGNDEDGQAVVDKTNDSTLFDDDDPKKPLTWDAAQARRARWYERHNYVRQSRMIIMHAVETIEMQRRCRASAQAQ